MKENEIDTELVKIDVVGSFSKPYEPIKGYTFNDFRELSTNEIESLFNDNNMTKEKGYIVWTNDNTEIGIVNVLMQPNPFGDDKDNDLAVYWDDDKLKDIIALPEDLFEIKQLSAMTIGENEDANEIKYVKTAQCSIIPKVNTDEKVELLATALNYIQLNPYFVKFYYDYIGSGEKNNEDNIYIPFLNGEYWQMNEGETSLARVFGYEDSKEYKDGESPLTFKIADESIAVIKNINGPRVELYAKSKGETTLTVTAPDGRTTTARVVVDEALPTTTTTARIDNTETTTTTTEKKDLYMEFLNGEYWQMNEGETSLARVFGYEDSKEYKDGESPLTFKIADESIAVIKNINGPRVELYAKSKGETTLTVTAPDGRTTTARVVVDEALPTTTTTVRINDTETTTTTVKIDYRVQVEYDKSPMKVGEKREVKFYNPNTKTAKNGKVNTSSECISIDYEEGKESFTVTALKEGKAEIYITAEGCAFGSYVNLEIISSETVKGDANCDGQLDMADAVMIMQALANPNKYGLNGTSDRHLTEQGKLNGDMNGDGLTVGDAQIIQKILLGLVDN